MRNDPATNSRSQLLVLNVTKLLNEIWIFNKHLSQKIPHPFIWTIDYRLFFLIGCDILRLFFDKAE